MRAYEVVIIIDTSLEDDAIQASVDRAVQFLTERGATVNSVDRWGKRRFAYELNHRWEGYYVLLSVTAESKALTELDRMLLLADEVVRHKVIRLPKEALAAKARRRRRVDETQAGTATPTDAIGA
jgi:small subunit ribosomal protein S6